VVTTLVCLSLPFAREAVGALGTRHSPRPLFSWANGFCKDSGASRREIAKVCRQTLRLFENLTGLSVVPARPPGRRVAPPDDRLRASRDP
jgi:hypothetical protein